MAPTISDKSNPLAAASKDQPFTTCVGPEEAKITLEQLRRGAHGSGTPEGITAEEQEMRSAAIAWNEAIIKGYASGVVVHTPFQPSTSYNNPEPITESASDRPPESPEDLQYLKSQNALKHLTVPPDERILISQMDFKALLNERPIGTIDPPIPGASFVSDMLRVPCLDGFYPGLSLNDNQKIMQIFDAQQFALPHASGAASTHKISAPNFRKMTTIPVMLGFEVAKFGENEAVAKPPDGAPAVWEARRAHPDLNYELRPAAADSDLLRVSVAKQ